MRYLTIEVTIQKEESSHERLTIEQVLRKQCGFTKKQIRQAKFRPDGILKNGSRCRVTEAVQPGDILKVCLEEEREVSRHLEGESALLDILYEDDDLLAVNKPAGLVTHPRGGHYQDTLANQAAAYFREKGEEHGVRPVGRLDKETSGVVVFAKNRMAAGRLQEQREKGIFQKTYLAVAQGEMEVDGKLHHICQPIGPDLYNRLKMQVTENGKYASTHYRVLKNVSGNAILEVTLDTGRTHQIRVHMASLGHPLVGDQLYGIETVKTEKALQGAMKGESFSDDGGTAGRRDMERAALHAWKVELYQPFTGKRIALTAPIPEELWRFR